MEKEKRILFYFIGWFTVALCIFLIGALNADAATYEATQFTAQLYDNYGPDLSSVTTNFTNNRWEGTIPQMVANSSGGAWAITSPIALIENHNYSITLEIDGTYGGNLVLSTFNRIGIGRWLDDAIYSYENGTAVDTIYSRVVGSTVQYAFTSKLSSSYIIIPFATNYSGSLQKFAISNVIIEDLGSDSLTQEEINTSLNNQTNQLNTSIQNSTNTITGEIDDMEQNIIDSNKENTEKEIESQKVCKNYDFNINNIKKINGYLSVNGNIYDGGSGFKHTDYIPLNKNENYTLSINFTNNNLAYCLYTKDKSLISCSKYSSQSFNITLSEDGYIRYSTRETYEVNFIGKYCENGNQALNDKLDDLNSSLTDSSSTDMSGLGDSAGWLPAGPVDSILTLPLTMLNSLVSNLSNNSCQTVSVELPFVKKNINLPCIRSLYDKMGVTGTLFTTAGLIASAFILFNYLLSLYKWVDDTLTMRENTMPGYFDDNWGGGA